jgi:hypothetical protein
MRIPRFLRFLPERHYFSCNSLRRCCPLPACRRLSLRAFPTLEYLSMPEHADEPSPDASQRRVQPFLDCVAYLLAKRWLREQRQQEEKPASSDQQSDAARPKP